jgi:3-keto-5-aminohexanoate cleavage enzyme
MIGTKVTCRLRMSARDAHYGGELVDGSRVLALFGDIATELMIRLDGDEGLFRAYESVEFLAPVFAGDFIEATAELVAVGNTSRRVAFEARKVITNVRHVAPSAAAVVDPPIVVVRAVGTCVVPKESQRKPRELYMPGLPVASPPAAEAIVTPPEALPVILAATIMGAGLVRRDASHRALTTQEVADEAARCRDAGAAVVHLHLRTDRAEAAYAGERFAELAAAIRRKCDCIVQPSTGAVGATLDERSGPLSARPEMATLECGSVNLGDDVLVSTRPIIRQLAAKMRAAGAVPELACYEIGHVEQALALAAEGALAKPLHFQFVLGVPGAIPAREEIVRWMPSLLPSDATWGVAAAGRAQRAMTELAIRLGGNARVGLDESMRLERGVLAEGSAPLVARAAAFARSVGREAADPARARAMLGVGAGASA